MSLAEGWSRGDIIRLDTLAHLIQRAREHRKDHALSRQGALAQLMSGSTDPSVGDMDRTPHLADACASPWIDDEFVNRNQSNDCLVVWSISRPGNLHTLWRDACLTCIKCNCGESV
ncbi:hypothetical protein [Rhizobium jaguaris]|uniref:hypothetical protein n=1 Tax=Rhizobium jaguaris TaxID=1312183 RepID=UPI0019693398|nr:hypothetical protein [Rhizobium jaguaris]